MADNVLAYLFILLTHPSRQWDGSVNALIMLNISTNPALTSFSITHSPALGINPKLICGGQTTVHINTTNIEIEMDGLKLVFLGVNLGKRWRYQTYRDWTGNGLTASDWIDRKAGVRGLGLEGETTGA